MPGRGWVLAGNLRSGDPLLCLSGETIPVDAVRDTGETATVYNSRVAAYHTYFVGAEPWGFAVWAHNTNGQGSSTAKGVQANKAAGDAWEAELLSKQLPKTQTQIQPQITIKSKGPSGKRVRLDAVGTDPKTGDIKLTDGKASATAPFTPNQKVVYPELETHGGVVVGEGKSPYIGGTQIPPTTVDILRKP